MNWLVKNLIKQARGRRYRENDKVRYFTDRRKGKGSIVHTPPFVRGTIQEFNPETKRYIVMDGAGETVEIHPRNIIPDSVSRPPEVVDATPELIEAKDIII